MLDELDMIIVTTADPLYELPAGAGWKYEGAIIDLVTSSSTPYLRSDEQARVTLQLAGDSLSLT